MKLRATFRPVANARLGVNRLPVVLFVAAAGACIGLVVLFAQSAPLHDWALLAAEFGVALGTIGLAWETYSLVVETRATRVAADTATHAAGVHERHVRESLAFRSALLDIADACNRWRSANALEYGGTAPEQIEGYALELPAVTRLLEQVTLPAHFNAELIWQLTYARAINARQIQPEVEQGAPASSWYQLAWTTVFLSLTVIACLVRTEAARRDLTEVAESFGDIPWWRPIEGMRHPSEAAENQTRRRWGGPPRPSGYDCWSGDGTPINT